jgi:hypothetical protein
MKPSAFLIPSAIILLPIASTGPVALTACMTACATAYIGCHGGLHFLAPYTFGVTSILAVGSCHMLFEACERECKDAAA